MKGKTILVVILMVLGATFSTVANSTPEATGLTVLHVKGSKLVKVVYKGETGKVKLNLYNASGSLIYSEVQAGAFIRPLNFEGLASGEYTVELIDSNGKKIEKINYSPASTVTTAKYVHINKLKDSNKYVVSVVGEQEADHLVTVRIFNGSKLIFDQTKKVSNEFAELYNVKSIVGPVTFEVVDNSGKVVSRSF